MSRDVVDVVSDYIRTHGLIDDEETILVGVSGGVDSMVCLTVLYRLGFDVEAFHVNYGLREGAAGDEALVRDWCERATPTIPLHVRHLDAEERAERTGESLQESARILRYEGMAECAKNSGGVVVAVGHHRDDQAETLLLNLLRGTGPEGLAGMPPSRPMQSAPSVDLVRPLLGISRSAIEQFADDEEIPWREDPTNRDPAYDRTVIRSNVIPLLQKHFPGASENIARAADLMHRYVETTVSPVLEKHWNRCYEDGQWGGRLNLDPIRELDAVWRRRIILEALEETIAEAPRSAAVADEVESLITAQVGRRMDVGGGTIWRERSCLRFVPAEGEGPGARSPRSVSVGEDLLLPGGVLRVDVLESAPDPLQTKSSNVEYVDAERLDEPLVVRPWDTGDRFHPLGLDGTKRVSELLTDAKVPPHRRSQTYVLLSGEQVVWVVGHRIDHDVRVRPETSRFARLTWQPRENTSDDCNST